MTTSPISVPVELAVIEFPGSRFNGEIVPALAELVDAGVVTVLDLVIITKEQDGAVTSFEITDLDEEQFGWFDSVDGEIDGLLSEDDLALAAEALRPGTTAALIVWESSWARRLVQAVAASGGRVVAHDRLNVEAVESALADAAAS